MSFNERLASLRKNIGLSQQDLAEAIDVSIDSIRRWEARKQEPLLSDLKQLAKVLGVTINELIYDADTQKSARAEKRYSDFKKHSKNINKIVIRSGHFAVEIPADDKGYDFLNSKFKGFSMQDTSVIDFEANS